MQSIKISRKIAAVVVTSLLSSVAAVVFVNLRPGWRRRRRLRLVDGRTWGCVKSWQIQMLIRCKWKLRCLWPGIKSHLSYLVRAALKPRAESQKQRLLMKWLFQNESASTHKNSNEVQSIPLALSLSRLSVSPSQTSKWVWESLYFITKLVCAAFCARKLNMVASL